MAMTTYAAIRERANRRRKVGWAVLAAGVLVGFVAIGAIFIEITVVGASPTGFTNCGWVAEPTIHAGSEGGMCSEVLGEYARAAWVSAGIALLTIAAGATLIARTPRY